MVLLEQSALPPWLRLVLSYWAAIAIERIIHLHAPAQPRLSECNGTVQMPNHTARICLRTAQASHHLAGRLKQHRHKHLNLFDLETGQAILGRWHGECFIERSFI
jgi:hypothetical protein